MALCCSSHFEPSTPNSSRATDKASSTATTGTLKRTAVLKHLRTFRRGYIEIVKFTVKTKTRSLLANKAKDVLFLSWMSGLMQFW